MVESDDAALNEAEDLPDAVWASGVIPLPDSPDEPSGHEYPDHDAHYDRD
jgi:hypothetical protein